MMDHEKVNILLVDDQPAKLLAYEVILKELGENLVAATSGREALEYLLKNEVAVILMDVCMPELDGFELAAMIREHPRFQKTAMIFISAIQVSDIDRLRGYEMGAVDYVPVPVIPEVLRAKIRVFVELYRKTRQLERLNAELEHRVRARTSELEESTARLVESEQRRSMAIAAGKMGSWDWDWVNGDWMWDEGQYQICGLDPQHFQLTSENIQKLLHPHDANELRRAFAQFANGAKSYETEFRLMRPDGELRWCVGTAAATIDKNGRVVRGAIDRPADTGPGHQRLCPGGRGTDQRTGADSHHSFTVELAGRENQAADRRGTLAVFSRRPDQGPGFRDSAGARHGADAGAGLS
jgi:CheY-like chemotaxis protein